MTTLSWYRHGTTPPEGLVSETPLVLLHAFPFDASMWLDVTQELDDIPVLTVDAPGFGSPLPPGVADGDQAPGLEPYADAVVADLAEMGVHRAVFGGLSMGGYTLLAIAERRPEVIAGLALMDTKASADDEDARTTRLEAAEGADAGKDVVGESYKKQLSPVTLESRPEVVANVREALAKAPAEGIAWAQRAMAARPDRLQVLGMISEPALVLRGSDDAAGPAEAADAMAGALAHATQVEVPDAGHLTNFEAPAAVAGALHQLYVRVVK